MGNHGRSWIGLFAFWALAVLMAALGPLELPNSPQVGVVDAVAAAPSPGPRGTFVVASR